MIVSENEVYEKALNKFGIAEQLIKCVEELSELQKELCKQALGQGNKGKIIEEIADVEIMIAQMKIAFRIGFYELNEAKDKKITRLNAKIDLLVKDEKQADECPNELKNEAKCKQCLYSFMTEEELVKLGSDPCDLCHDLCNWKPKELNPGATPKI